MSVITACAVLPLILVGAGVTSKDAGMAFPDGFTARGYFWANPPGWFVVEDTRWEHGHRLLGRAVGILSIVLAVWCWRCGGVVRVLGVCNLLAVTTQGVLGALRVNEVSTGLAMVHGVFGQLCFCLTCTVALVTGRAWTTDRGTIAIRAGGFLSRLCLAGAVCVFLQLLLGAAYRHFGSRPVLVAHVLWAIVVSLMIGWIAMWIMGSYAGPRVLVRLAQAVGVLMVVQLMLGGMAFVVVSTGVSHSALLQWALPSAHVLVGALLLASTVLLTVCAYQMLRWEAEPRGVRMATPVAVS